MAEKVVEELFATLASKCDLDEEIIMAIKPGFLEVIEKHLKAPVEAPVEVKPKAKKVTAKRPASPKGEKIAHKNAYHFFVAEKMSGVKEAGVGAKDRMKHIGENWKKLTDEERKVFQDRAAAWNASVDESMATDPDWLSHKDAVLATANKAAGVPAKALVTPPPVEEPVEEVKAPTPEPVAPVPVPAPVVVPEPVVEPVVEPVAAPVVRKTTRSKPKTK